MQLLLFSDVASRRLDYRYQRFGEACFIQVYSSLKRRYKYTDLYVVSQNSELFHVVVFFSFNVVSL